MGFLQKLAARLKEPSTWAGLGVVALTLGVDPNKVSVIGQAANAIAQFVPVDGGVLAHVVMGMAGGIAAVLPEHRPPLVIVKGTEQG